MVRSQWMAAVVMGLAWTSLARTQSPPLPASNSATSAARYITVNEDGKAPQRCQVLKSWREADGTTAYQVRAVDSGEVMTIVESGSVPAPREKSRGKILTRIFHWGRGNKPPTGTPIPPQSAPMWQTPTNAAPRYGSPTPLPMPTGYAPSQPRPYSPTSLTSATSLAGGGTSQGGNTNSGGTASISERPDVQARLTPLPAGCANCQSPCNPCCQPSCTTCPPQQKQSGVFSRIFHPKSSTVVAAQTVVTPPQQTMRNPAVQVPAPPLEPRDWRESWGKVEPWRHTTSDKGDERVEAPKAPKRQLEPLPPPTRIVQAPAQTDPLTDPHWYRDVALRQKPVNSKVPDENSSSVPMMQPKKAPVMRSAFRAPVVKQSKPNVAPNQSAEASEPVRLNGRVVDVPANEANAFWTPTSAPPKKIEAPKYNAFDKSEQAPSQPISPMQMAGAAMNQMPMGGVPISQMPMPMPPRQRMITPVIDSGVPSGMGNAFTLAGSRRPIPADFGPTPQEANGFGDYLPVVPPQPAAMPPRPNMPPMMPGLPGMPMGMPQGGMMPVNPYMAVPSTPMVPSAPTAAAQPMSVPQIMLTLKDSLLPSQREMAADQLGESNWRLQPQVVQSLTRGAREDPAPTVRAACVRALGHMQANTLDVLETLRSLKNDGDPQVRQQVDDALVAISAGGVSRQDSGLRQASHP